MISIMIPIIEKNIFSDMEKKQLRDSYKDWYEKGEILAKNQLR